MFKITHDNKGTAVVTGALTIADIEVLHAELNELYNKGTCKTIDFSGVGEIDVAVLQLLIACKRSFWEMGRRINYISSPAIDEALELSGLKKLFLAAA